MLTIVYNMAEDLDVRHRGLRWSLSERARQRDFQILQTRGFQPNDPFFQAPPRRSPPFDHDQEKNWVNKISDLASKSKGQAQRVSGWWTDFIYNTRLDNHIAYLEKRGYFGEHSGMAAIDIRRGSTRPGTAIGGPISGMIHRPSLAENVRTASRDSVASTQSALGASGAGEEKPLASGNGVSLSITLAEPVLFLQGFDPSELGNRTTTMLRGSFHLRVSKSAKIKTISLAFRGRAETEWPEGEC